MKRRPGFTHLILDSPRCTIAFGGAYFGNGSHRPFVIEVYWRSQGGKGVSKRRFSLILPLMSWGFAYRHNLTTLWDAQNRILHRLFCTRSH